MSTNKVLFKTANESRILTFRWTAILAQDEVIVKAQWFIDPGLTSIEEDIQGTDTLIKLGSGVPGTSYDVRCIITTSREVYDRSIILVVMDEPIVIVT